MCKATLAVFCFFILGSQAMSKGQKENARFGNWEIRSGQDEEKTPKLSNTDKMLSLWETYLCSHMFKVHTLRRLTDNSKFVLAKINFKFHFLENNQDNGGRVDLITMNMKMKEEEGLVRPSEEEEQIRKKMKAKALEKNLVKIGEVEKHGKIENKKKKNTGGGAEEEKGGGDDQKMRAWRKKMLRRMG